MNFFILQGPKLEKAAIVIQRWWRKQSEILKIRRKRQESGALTIQHHWRRFLKNKKLMKEKQKQIK